MISSEKSEKNQKKIGRGRMFTAALVQGGAGILATSLNARLLRCIWL